MLNFIKGLYTVIYNIIRGIIRFVVHFTILFVAEIIFFVTYEKGKRKCITTRKAKRIRALSKFKFFIFKLIPEKVSNYLGFERYKKYFNKHLTNGLQLRNYRTDKQAV